jgi:hypothetical protein
MTITAAAMTLDRRVRRRGELDTARTTIAASGRRAAAEAAAAGKPAATEGGRGCLADPVDR